MDRANRKAASRSHWQGRGGLGQIRPSASWGRTSGFWSEVRVRLWRTSELDSPVHPTRSDVSVRVKIRTAAHVVRQFGEEVRSSFWCNGLRGLQVNSTSSPTAGAGKPLIFDVVTEPKRTAISAFVYAHVGKSPLRLVHADVNVWSELIEARVGR